MHSSLSRGSIPYTRSVAVFGAVASKFVDLLLGTTAHTWNTDFIVGAAIARIYDKKRLGRIPLSHKYLYDGSNMGERHKR